MAEIRGSGSGYGAEVDIHGSMQTGLYDSDGNPIMKLRGGKYAVTDRLMPVGGLNDGYYRAIRLDRSGAVASAKISPQVNFALETAALPSGWYGAASTFTLTYALSTGAFLNAAGTGAVSSHASIVSMFAVPKYQKTHMLFRARARLIKGSTNGLADIGLSTTQAPAALALTNGFVFWFGADGTLKPTIFFNDSAVIQGTDFAAALNSTTYYTWDVLADDNSVRFICQEPTSGEIICDQTLNVNIGEGLLGLGTHFYAHARSYVLAAAANVGTATQMYVGNMSVQTLDMDQGKPWAHIMAGHHQSGLINPTVALTQLANYANSAAPTSATLSNTAAGYTNLGGQFQFAAVAGAETDYALFAFQVPAPYRLNVTGIDIDTMNTGAAVATTETWLQWAVSANALAATLASNTFRVGLGNQVFPIAAAIGAQAARINKKYDVPLVTEPGRFFHVMVKMPRGTATASQVIRGLVNIEGYFE